MLRILLAIIVLILLTACATPPASPAATNVPTRTMTTLPTATATEEPTPTAKPTAEPTETAEPTPTATPTSENVAGDIEAGNYEAVKAGLESAVEAGEYNSMQKAITEVLLPIFHEQTVYSDQVFERIVPDFASVEVNGQGQLQVLDADGDVLIEKTVPGTSNLEWAIPIIKLAYGIEEVGIIDGKEVNEEERIEWFFSAFESGEVAKIKENGLHNGWFVLDREIQLETPFIVSVGGLEIEIPTLGTLYFEDAQGVQQMVYAPFFSYDEQRMMWHIIDGGIGRADSKEEFERLMDLYESGALEKNGGPRTMVGRPRLKVGQILFLGFNTTVNPELSVGAKEMFADVMGFYTQTQLDEFARTGDPSVLPEVSGYGPFLIPLSEGSSNRLTKYQDN